MGWSVTEDLLCVADDGTVMVYDNNDNMMNNYYSWRNQENLVNGTGQC